MCKHIAQLATLSTYCLMHDEAKMKRNIDRLADRARSLGIVLPVAEDGPLLEWPQFGGW